MAQQEKLTDSFVRSAKPPAGERNQVIHYDSEVKGFGVRVTRFGARAFILNYRARGVERRYTIGSYPDWRVATAREEAKRLKRLVDQGRDPMGERYEERAAPTVNDLVDRYLSEHAPRKRERSRRDDQSMIAQWIKPELGNRKVADVRHEDIERLHRKITTRGAPTRANRVAALLSKMFALAIRWEMRADNPARGLERNSEEKRTRYLSGDELRRLTEALAVYENAVASHWRAAGRAAGSALGSVRSQGGGLDKAELAHQAKARASRAPFGTDAAAPSRDEGSGRSASSRGESGTFAVPLSGPPGAPPVSRN